MGENGEIYTAGKNFTLPQGMMGGTNLNSCRQRGGAVDKNILIYNPW